MLSERARAFAIDQLLRESPPPSEEGSKDVKFPSSPGAAVPLRNQGEDVEDAEDEPRETALQRLPGSAGLQDGALFPDRDRRALQGLQEPSGPEQAAAHLWETRPDVHGTIESPPFQRDAGSLAPYEENGEGSSLREADVGSKGPRIDETATHQGGEEVPGGALYAETSDSLSEEAASHLPQRKDAGENSQREGYGADIVNTDGEDSVDRGSIKLDEHDRAIKRETITFPYKGKDVIYNHCENREHSLKRNGNPTGMDFLAVPVPRGKPTPMSSQDEDTSEQETSYTRRNYHACAEGFAEKTERLWSDYSNFSGKMFLKEETCSTLSDELPPYRTCAPEGLHMKPEDNVDAVRISNALLRANEQHCESVKTHVAAVKSERLAEARGIKCHENETGFQYGSVHLPVPIMALPWQYRTNNENTVFSGTRFVDANRIAASKSSHYSHRSDEPHFYNSQEKGYKGHAGTSQLERILCEASTARTSHLLRHSSASGAAKWSVSPPYDASSNLLGMTRERSFPGSPSLEFSSCGDCGNEGHGCPCGRLPEHRGRSSSLGQLACSCCSRRQVLSQHARGTVRSADPLVQRQPFLWSLCCCQDASNLQHYGRAVDERFQASSEVIGAKDSLRLQSNKAISDVPQSLCSHRTSQRSKSPTLKEKVSFSGKRRHMSNHDIAPVRTPSPCRTTEVPLSSKQGGNTEGELHLGARPSKAAKRQCPLDLRERKSTATTKLPRSWAISRRVSLPKACTSVVFSALRSVCKTHQQRDEDFHLDKEDNSCSPFSERMKEKQLSSLAASPMASPSASCPGTVQILQGGERGGGVRVELCHADLWEAFNRLNTEMIITKAGRRMFPAVKVKVTGLEPSGLYRLSLDVLPLDRHKYRYVYHCSKWMVSGSGEILRDGQRAVHPDSPLTGLAVQDQVVSFEKVKLTNNHCRGPSQISLASMQRYQPRLHIERLAGTEGTSLVGTEGTCQDGEKKVTEHYVALFPQTAFMAVTAYQNQQITKLKIAMNPFAKGFRDAAKHNFHGNQTCPPVLPASSRVSGFSPQGDFRCQKSHGHGGQLLQ